MVLLLAGCWFTSTAPHGRGCPCALSMSASIVRRGQNRREGVRVGRRQADRDTVAEYGSTRVVSTIFLWTQIAEEPGPCTGSSGLRIKPQSRGIARSLFGPQRGRAGGQDLITHDMSLEDRSDT